MKKALIIILLFLNIGLISYQVYYSSYVKTIEHQDEKVEKYLANELERTFFTP